MLKRIQDIDPVAALRDGDKFPIGREGNESPITATMSQIVRYVQTQFSKIFQPIGNYASLAQVLADSRVARAIASASKVDQMQTDIGQLSRLSTTSRRDLVAAINEVNRKVGLNAVRDALAGIKASDDINEATLAYVTELGVHVSSLEDRYQEIAEVPDPPEIPDEPDQPDTDDAEDTPPHVSDMTEDAEP